MNVTRHQCIGERTRIAPVVSIPQHLEVRAPINVRPPFDTAYRESATQNAELNWVEQTLIGVAHPGYLTQREKVA